MENKENDKDPRTFFCLCLALCSGPICAAFVGDGSGISNISGGNLADDSVTSAKITNGTISDEDMSSQAQISFSKLAISANDITGLGFSTYYAGTGLNLSGTTFSIGSQVVTSNYSGLHSLSNLNATTVSTDLLAANSVSCNGVVTANGGVSFGGTPLDYPFDFIAIYKTR
jgi:hypothetical protein